MGFPCPGPVSRTPLKYIIAERLGRQPLQERYSAQIIMHFTPLP